MSNRSIELRGHNYNRNPGCDMFGAFTRSSHPPTLLHVSFLLDHRCFAVGTDNGFRVFSCDPFRKISCREFAIGGFSGVDMLYRYNIMALVSGGSQPRCPPNKVILWHDKHACCIGELVFRSNVLSVRLLGDKIVVVLRHKVYVYSLPDLTLFHQIVTIANPDGLCVVSQLAGSLVLACPGLHKGQVRVERYSPNKIKYIMAHDSKIACLEFTLDGQFLATASSKGTLVRVFSTIDGTLLQEV